MKRVITMSVFLVSVATLANAIPFCNFDNISSGTETANYHSDAFFIQGYDFHTSKLHDNLLCDKALIAWNII